jgi:hypothetical protein
MVCFRQIDPIAGKGGKLKIELKEKLLPEKRRHTEAKYTRFAISMVSTPIHLYNGVKPGCDAAGCPAGSDSKLGVRAAAGVRGPLLYIRGCIISDLQ